MAGSILTNIGLAKLAAATVEEPVNITNIAVGDGNGGFPTLSPTMTELTNEVWRGTASNPIRDSANSNYVYFETNIPPEAGPFDVREIACFDVDGDMIAIGHTSLIQKPDPLDDASFTVAVRIFIALENASDFDLIYQNTEVTSHNALVDRNAIGAHDDVYIRTVTSAKAIAEDAPVGTRYVFTDFNNARYDVVEITDTGGYYIPLSGSKKFKLYYSNSIDFGHLKCVLDGITDNTPELLVFLGTLSSDSTVSIVIPNNLKYDLHQVAAALPLRCNVIDNSGINGWDSSGFRQKILQVYEKGDPSAIVDLNQVLSSGHNASHVLENTGESGSISGDKRVISWSWSSGRFKKDEPGLRLMARNEYAKSAVRDDIWAYTVRKRAPWLAKDYEIWRTGQAFAVGDICLANSTKRYYKALNSGNAGTTEPSHNSGSVSDGSITWDVLDA